MEQNILTFLISSLCIIVAGVILVRSADAIADRTRLGRLLVGSLILAGATSLTELFVGVNAVKNGAPDLAMGNLIGGCLVNLLILAIADIMHRGGRIRFSKTSASHALTGSISIALMILLAMGILLSSLAKEFIFGGIGIGSWAILLSYFLFMRIIFQNQQFLENAENSSSKKVVSLKALVPSFLNFSLAAVVIILASPYLVNSAETLSDNYGLEKSFIGLTIVSLTTSLPELVATIQAVRMGAYELALGNILGSNIYNIILVAILDFFNEGPILSSVSYLLVFSCLAVILATSVAVIGQLYQVERKRDAIVEPDAAAIFVIIFGTMFITYRLG